MRCSSCEPLLDRYIECTLTPRQMRDVSSHLRECRSCSELLDEVRAVDGLLFTTSAADLPENFTFAVMAEVNSMPSPHARQHPVWSFLALYVAAAWVAAVLGIAYTGTSPGSLLSALYRALAAAGGSVGHLASAASHNMGQSTPALATFGIGLLTLDAAVAAAIALVYFIIRPRLAARLASVSEVSS